MTLVSSKSELKQHLDSGNTLLILIGDDATTQDVHKKAQEMKKGGTLRPEQQPLRVEDMSLLSPSQITQWSATQAGYTVLKPDAAGTLQRILSGSTTELLNKDGTPSALRIKGAFAGVQP
jgi:hypothetical protein